MFLEFVQDLLRSPRLNDGAAWVRRTFVAGENLTTEGRLGQSLFIVEQGGLAVLGRAQIPNQSTLEVTVAELSVGDVFGESALIGNYESIATVRALTDGSVLEINAAIPNLGGSIQREAVGGADGGCAALIHPTRPALL